MIHVFVASSNKKLDLNQVSLAVPPTKVLLFFLYIFIYVYRTIYNIRSLLCCTFFILFFYSRYKKENSVKADVL